MRRPHLIAGLLVVAFAAAAVWGERPSPADGRIEYRPGAWFSPDFPLHGTVKLLTPPVAEMGSRHRIRIEYTVGDLGAKPGESIEVWKHFTSDVEELQDTDASEPAFFGVETSAAGVEIDTVIYPNDVQRNEHPVFPYRKCAGLIVRNGELKQGDKVYFDIGGAKGVRMQFYAENLFNLRIAFTQPEEKKVLGYGGDAYMKIIGGPLAKLKVKAPAVVGQREPFDVEVVPTDAWNSLAKDYQNLELVMESDAVGSSELRFDPDLLHYVAENVVATGEGVARITVRTADGRVQGVSNPIWISRTPGQRIYFGDLHQHTYLSDGRGVPIELYLLARQIGLLDFGALTPHQTGLQATGPYLAIEQKYVKDFWPQLIEGVKTMKGWKGFTPILGYEYSVGTQAGGHHNVIYADDEAPTTMDLEPESWRAPVGEMMKILRRTGKRAMVIPHIGGGPPDWQHETDPRLERLFEIASVHGVFEESFQKHLESGQRLGATASADNHTVSWGYANPGLIYTMTNPLTGVYADSNDREDLWASMLDRRTYGVTGNSRMLLDFSVNGEPMGGDLPRYKADSAKIRAKVSGEAPILRIDLLKNNQVVHSLHPGRDSGSSLVRIAWSDNDYQRRANTSMARGEIRADAGRLVLKRYLNQDNSFESVSQDGARVVFYNATTSNDRDGVLVDISQAQGDALTLRRDDPLWGVHEVRIPLAELRRNGSFRTSAPAPAEVKDGYIEKMGVPLQFTVEAELVSPAAPLDVEYDFEQREAMQPGDYYYLRVEQLDLVQAWSSPVWAN
ncbi:MAG: hypothetical protein GC160_29435 [Acidobacteria bacterium]|nr:hypothetical protein [Acidobacteriota bacterium]